MSHLLRRLCADAASSPCIASSSRLSASASFGAPQHARSRARAEPRAARKKTVRYSSSSAPRAAAGTSAAGAAGADHTYAPPISEFDEHIAASAFALRGGAPQASGSGASSSAPNPSTRPRSRSSSSSRQDARTSTSGHELSRVVVLRGVPSTISPPDIYQLLPDYRRHIVSLSFPRMPDMTSTGRVAVSFARTDASAASGASGAGGRGGEETWDEMVRRRVGAIRKETNRAREFAVQAREWKLGGRRFGTELAKSFPPAHPTPSIAALIAAESGRLVLFKGLPLGIAPFQIERILNAAGFALRKDTRLPRASKGAGAEGREEMKDDAVLLIPQYERDVSGRTSLLIRLASHIDAQRLALEWNRRVFVTRPNAAAQWKKTATEMREIQEGEGPRFVVDAEVVY